MIRTKLSNKPAIFEFPQTNLSRSFDQWKRDLIKLGTIEKHVQFYIGDKILEGETEGYIQRGKYDLVSELTGIPKHTLQNYVSICNSISSRRREELDFSHHTEVAKLEPENQEYFLNKAVTNKWSVSDLRIKIREKEYKKLSTTLMPSGIYRIIYADPPWDYRDKCEGGGIQSKPIEDHYPTMGIEELCEMELPKTQQNAVLFLWVPSPKINEVFEVIEAWGFQYKTSFVWDKVKHNMGHYNSVRHEFLLICGKGKSTPDTKELFDSVQSIEKTRRHSEKPERFREIIDTSIF